MNKVGFLLVLLAISAAHVANALELFSLDCDGGIRFLPSFPIGGQFDFSAGLGVAETFLSIYKDRLKCMCSDLTDDEFNRMFHPFFGADMAFNVIQGPDADLSLSKCSLSAFDSTMMRANRFNYYKVNLTETCSYATWKRDGKCLLQSQTFNSWDVTVKAGLFRCPNAPWRPAMSVICEGAGCDQAFIPCMSNSDCAGDMTCQEFTFDQMARPSADDMLAAFKSMFFADDLSSSCVPTGDIIMKTVDLVRKMWKQGSATYTSPQVKICSPIQLNFWRNMTFDWQSLIHYNPNESFFTSNSSINIPGYLQPWNGNLNSGGQMTAPQNVGAKPSNEGAITQGATLVFKKSCEGSFTFLPSSGIGMTFNLGVMRTMIDHWVSTVSSVLKCRFDGLGESISDQELTNRYALGLDWLFFWLDSQTSGASLTRGELRDYRINYSSRINLPSSCNYDTWIKTGACRVSSGYFSIRPLANIMSHSAKYTGLSNLLGIDVSANVEVKRCDSSSDFSVVVECVGQACSLLNLKTNPCNSDADCANSLSCQDLNPRMANYDWLSAYVRVNTTTSPACSRSGSAINAETRELIFSYLGLQYDGSSVNKYCMIDYDHVSSQASTWVNGEVETTSPGVITLKNLQPWDVAVAAVSSAVVTACNCLVAAVVALAVLVN